MDEKYLTKYKELLPDGAWNNEQLLVGRYNGITYILIFLICLGMGLFMLWGSIMNFISGGWEPGLILLFGSFMFIILCIVFGIYITSCVLIFYPEGLVYRSFLGKIFVFKNEEILGVMSLGVGKNRHFRIKTKNKTIVWGVYARNYYKMERYALERYINLN